METMFKPVKQTNKLIQFRVIGIRALWGLFKGKEWREITGGKKDFSSRDNNMNYRDTELEKA